MPAGKRRSKRHAGDRLLGEDSGGGEAPDQLLARLAALIGAALIGLAPAWGKSVVSYWFKSRASNRANGKIVNVCGVQPP